MTSVISYVPPPVQHYLLTLVGALMIFVFSAGREPAGPGTFIRKMFPQKSELFYDRLDFLLVTGLGSVIGFIFFDPDNAIHSLSAGLSWSSGLSILSKKV
jgi:hypothetical protein